MCGKILIVKGCDNIENISKYKVDSGILISIIIFAIISVISIMSAQTLLKANMQNLYIKQK